MNGIFQKASLSLYAGAAGCLFAALGTQASGATIPSAPLQNPLRISRIYYPFGPTIVGAARIQKVTKVTNTGSESVALNPRIDGDPSFTVVTTPDGVCGPTIAPHASCAIAVQFLPEAAQKRKAVGILSIGPRRFASFDGLVLLEGESRVLAPGDVSPTANPQVAQYTLTLPYKGSWSVRFGPTTSYGRSTSVQTVETAGTPTSMYVAGMLPNTTYHVQATLTLPDGATAADEDHTFTTGALPAGIPNTLAASTTPGQTPQPGVELINTLIGAIRTTAIATDLQGNVIWTYPFPDRTAPSELFPVRLLPNGHFLCLINPVYPALPTAGVLNVIREFDLAGNTVQQLSMDDLNARLTAKGFPLQLTDFSHDIVVLPNGHYLVIAVTVKAFTDLPGYPGVTNVGGDVVVDLDSSFQPVWLWNSFDHLDINRHPWNFPDWTHANSVAYSKDDGDFIISLRHQNWVLKVDYKDGTGTGNVIWHLGEGGDFTLLGATDPTDWFYAQHDAEFSSTNTSGTFSMTLFDNGDDRKLPDGVICGPLPGQTPCTYSTVSEMSLDESAKTASYLFHQVLPPNLYSAFAGSNQLLPNGDFEYNLAGVGSSAYVFEVTPGPTLADAPQTVWQMQLPGTNTYRSTRLPSLYPGVQW